MDFNAALDQALTRLHDEGRYRTFIDIERKKGHFPKAMWNKPDGTSQEITVGLFHQERDAIELTVLLHADVECFG